MRACPREPAERRVRVNGVELCWFEWGAHAAARGPTLLLAHATGFHARCWDPLVSRLGARHVIALDQRGHGRSEVTEIRHWRVFGEDLAEFARALDLRDLLGVGHSMGGHALVDAAAARSDRFRSLVLIDPVIAAPGEYGGGGWTIESFGGEPHPTAKRKRSFASAEEMFERFRDREPYSVFTDAALRAYCEFGLLPDPAGQGLRLACPPETEASIYMSSRSNARVHESIRALEIPVLVLRAKLPPRERSMMDFSSSPTWPGLVGELRSGREIHFPDHTHFLPMEIPDRIAELIATEAGDG